MRHLENMAKVMLATGMIVAYGYFIEFFMSLYSGQKYEYSWYSSGCTGRIRITTTH